MRETITGTLAIFACVSPKYGSSATAGARARQQVARARALDGEDAPVVGDVLDLDVEPADELLEVGEVRLGRGQQELLRPEAEDDAVLDDEAAVVAPGRVLGVPDSAGPDVAGEHAGRGTRSASGPWIRYLYSGDESKMPAALRIAKYSNFSDIW